MTEIELKYSKHCQSVTNGGSTIQLHIYSSGENDWLLEVVDEYGNSTCWDEPFETDDSAYSEFERTLAEEGIHALIGEPPGGKPGKEGAGA